MGPASRLRWLLDPAWLRRLALYIQSNRIDTVISSSLISALHGWAAARLTGCRWILDQHNHESKLIPLLTPLERWLCARANQVWACSEVDAAALRRLSGREVATVPNGADLRAPAGHCERLQWRMKFGFGDRPVALFFGTWGYAPNREAIGEIEGHLRQRLPDWDWVVAGHSRSPQTVQGVRVLGFVERLDGLLAAADAVVVPLRRGSGTRLKILEALAAGCPVVSTAAGAEGLPATALAPLLQVAETWNDFVEAVRRTPSLTRAVPPAMSSLSWDAAGARMRQLLGDQLPDSPPEAGDVAERNQS